MSAADNNGWPEPIDMVLHCPACGMQHIDGPDTPKECDGGERSIYMWQNPPHRSHLCAGCSHVWRPADVPTNGVAAVKTAGKNDSPIEKDRLRAWPFGVRAVTSQSAEPCPVCFETEPNTGACGTSEHDTRALCRRVPVAAPLDDEPTADELEAFRRKHWSYWTAAENLLISHLVSRLRCAAIRQRLTPSTHGREALWLWFSLSYASWLTLPRVLMHEMPDDWQARMAALLDEWSATWDTSNMPTPRVQAVDDGGRLSRFPAWLSNYRHPDREAVNALRTPTNHG